MPSNPITPQEQYDILINRSLTPRDGVTTDTYMAAGYILMPPATVDGPVKWRLFDGAYVQTGIIDPNRLGSGATGAGNLYLADDGTWKVISGAPGVGDMLKATYDVDNDGTVDSAERIEIIVRNSTGTTLTKGTVVYLSGATGNRPNALRAQANSEATSSKTFGFVVEDINNNADGYVACNGTLHDLDTSAFADGVSLWLSPSTAGGWTTTVPSEPNHSVFLGYVARSHPTAGRVVILIQNGYELNELHDVVAPSPTNGDLLQWDGVNQYWKNVPVLTASPIPTLQQVTTAGNTTTNAILAAQFQINGTTRNARLSSDNVGGFDINYNIGGTPDWRWFGGGTTALTTFKANGNVLIGTTTDAGYRLDVTGTTRVTSNVIIDGSLGIGTNNPAAKYHQYQGQGIMARYDISTANADQNRGVWDFYTNAAVAPDFFGRFGFKFEGGTADSFKQFQIHVANSVVPQLVVSGAGFVGFGTTYPAAKLHVVGSAIRVQSSTVDASTKDFSFIQGHYTNAQAPFAIINTVSNAAQNIIWIGGGSASYNTATDIRFFTAATSTTLTGTERMKIASDGNVGIGTTNPLYRLDVQGTATSHAISTQVGLNFNPVVSPTTGSLALVASAGNVDLGIHYYYVTFTTALGETNPYQIGNITTTAGNQQVTVTIPVSTDPRVTGRKLYRTKAGANFWETFNLATIANNTATSYVDNIADASLTGTSGTGFYQVNTTYRAITINGTQSLVVDQYATYLGVGAGGGVTSGGGNNTFIGYLAGRYSYTSNQSVAVGNAALSAQTAGGNNIGIGSQAGGFTTGGDNIAIGRNAAVNINTGSSNTIVGSFSWNLGAVTGKNYNTGLGYRVGSNNTGSYNLFLGNDAGYYVTGSNQILLDTVGRADEATAKSSALIYGVTNATSASQTLSLGGGGNVMIGTLTNAGYKLDVNGTFRASGAVTFGGTSFRVSPYEFQGTVYVPNTLDGTNNTCYLNIGTFSDSFTHIVVEVELVPWLLNTSNIGTYSKTYVIRMTTSSPGVVSLFGFNVTKDIGSVGAKYQLGTPIANASNLLQIPVHYIGTGSGNQIAANIRVTGAISGNIDKVSLAVGTPSAVSAGTQEYVSFQSRVGIGTTTPVHDLVVNGNTGISINASGSTFPNIHRDSVDGGMLLRSWNGSVFSNSIKITPAGNVGIGTISPTQKLEVVGNTKLRGVSYFGSINAPSTPTITNNSPTGGTLAAATYYYKIVAMDYFNNTTTPSNEVSVTTTGTTSSVSISWPVVPGAYNYRIYRGTTSGGQNTYYLAFGTNGNGYTDTGAAGTAGTTPTENTTSYGSFNTGDGLLRTGNILIANNGVGNISSINFDKSTDGPAINVVEYANDSTMFEFSLADNPDGPDAFHFVMPDWQNPSTGWKPFKFAAFTTQVVGKDTNFWSSFSMPSSTPYFTTNDNRLSHAQTRYDPYTSTTYNLIRDTGTGTGNLNVDVTGYTGATYSIYWVTIESPTTFKWGTGSYGGTPVATGVTITGGWQVLGTGIQVKLTGTFVANDRWAFRAFPVPKMGIGTTTPIAPLQVSTTIAAVSGTARGVYFNPTVVATANNDTLVGLEVTPSFTTGAFTGVSQMAARFNTRVHISNNNILSIGANTVSNDTSYGNGYITSFNQSFTINGSGGTPYFRLHHTTGNLVLQNGGTFTDAGYRLDVNGTARVTGNTVVSGRLSVGTTSTAGTGITISGSTVLLGFAEIQGGNSFYFYSSGNTYNSVINQQGANLIIAPSANVGIGISSPVYKLDVNGTFRAQGSITATLANTVTSSMVYYNSSTGLLTYGALPAPTAFQIDYDYNIVGIKNGVNVVFTTSANFVLTTTRVYLNGQRLTRGVGYDYVETGTNQVTFANPLNPTDQIIIEYQL